jgi:transcriptional regulator with XRE-family HTH domain
MVIGKRIRQLREERKLSQEAIEKRTGLLRRYISRVENGHTVPSLETLERLAEALEMPLYQLFYEGGELTALPSVSHLATAEELVLDGEGEKPPALYERTRRLLEKWSKASADARQVFRTLAQGFSKL